jgi:membrane protein
VRWAIEVSVGGTSIYGPLSAPIVLLIWLYVLAIAVLIGAAFNAAIEEFWPRREITEARQEAQRDRASRRRQRRLGLDTGEIDLPPNRSPAKNPLAPTREQR